VASLNAPSLASSVVETAFARVSDRASALAFTANLARTHYENFSVVSLLLPKRLVQDFANIYAFCRIADDLGDEVGSADDSLKYLDRFREELRACYAGNGGNAQSAVFVALGQTIEKHQIPIDPFLALISAFEQDQRTRRYETFEQLLDYCTRSANPVGHLVLYVCGYRDAERQRLSDFTCSALQLANFWQDVRRDLADLDRIYIPRTSLERFGVTEQQLADGRADEAFCSMLRSEVDRTEAMFAQGEALLPTLDPSVRRHIALFGMGGRAILEAIRRQNYDTLTRRPTLSSWQKGRLAARALALQVLGGFSQAGRGVAV
jgi:squalene synthase HpnC